MKITIKKRDDMDDWYTIEKADHDGSYGMRPTQYGFAMTYSGRISNADVEGTAAEMLSIAEAIEKRGEVSHTRCEVRVEGQRAYFCSPRNSTCDGVVSLAEADELAAEIRALLETP
jgi:hypothetical protein